MCGGELAGEDAHQGGFSGTVGTDYAVAVATVECKVHVLEERALSKLNPEVVGLNHLSAKIFTKLIISAHIGKSREAMIPSDDFFNHKGCRRL